MLAKETKTYTYNDYLTYDEGERIEIIEGNIYAMSPAPSRIHQKIIMKISNQLENYIKSNNGSCEVYPAPFDVILKNDDEEVGNSKNVVQPDISVICDKSKLTDKGCTGSPNMIIEVVSPYNPSNDFVKKLNLYQDYKVQEYWIINPMKKNILVYNLTDTGYDTPNMYSFNDVVPVSIFKELNIDFSALDLT
ncbi:Uma2 family endonuclease [Clostridium paraputrificum]|uniref:Uma2 family endonuclease n=1 Tax=Clostridium paraputrificum TaxID=29363 RepID=UPI0003FB899F|nr:Uma2 family endonuclease [Clostridium paraputrificum]MDB2122851.1 Uma2 family endonuclease [Clostridium paraputrificum]